MNDALERVAAAKAKLREHEQAIRAHMKDERRAKHEESVMRRAGPTPETKAKLRADPHCVDVLRDRGVIDGGQAKDMEDIEAGYRLVTQETAPRLSSPVRSDRGEIPERDWEIRCVTRYREWALDLIGPRLISQKVCLMAAVDGMSLSDIDVRIRKREGTAKKLLLDGLRVYQAVKKRVR